MLRNRTSIVAATSIFLMFLLIGQAFIRSNDNVAHAQAATTINFPGMNLLSPNGQKVVYVTAQNLSMVGSTIWVANANGSQSTALVTGDSSGDSYWVTNPIWSPDGQQIAYVKAVKNAAATDFVAYKYEIWAIQSNGSNNRLLTNTLFSPFLGYGGQTDLLWNAANEIEFPGIAKSSYAVNATTLAVRQISNPNLGDLPNTASISGVPAYSKTDSHWAGEYLNKKSTCGLKIGAAGGAVTAAAMILDYEISDVIQPNTVNNRMRDSGFTYDPNDSAKKMCWIIWARLADSDKFPAIEVNDSYVWNDPNPITFDIVRRYIASDVPLILWNWETYNEVKRWLVVTGYDGNNITAINAGNGESVSGDFYSFGFQGAVIIQKDQFFSKVSPANASGPTVDRNAVTLEWGPILPTPDSYRYCIYQEGTSGQCASNSSQWVDVGLNTQVALGTLEDNITYRWQVQAVTNSSTVDANGGDFWEFTPGLVYPPPNVTFSGNAGTDGVTITYTNEGDTTTTDSNGNYSFTVENDTVGTITPSKACYTFDPIDLDYDANSDPLETTGFDFTASLNSYSISGSVGTTNVTLEYTIDNVSQTSIVLGNSGLYTIPNLPCGSTVTVTPTKADFTFFTASKTYNNLSANQTNQNYFAHPTFITISGNVQENNVGIGGIVIKASCSNNTCSPSQATTDPAGNYILTHIPWGSTVTLTPSSNAYHFPTPSISLDQNTTISNLSNQNFTAIKLFKISGNVSLPPGIQNVVIDFVKCPATGCIIDTELAAITTDNNGNYTAYVERNWSGKLKPRQPTAYWLTPSVIAYTNIQADISGQDYDYGFKISGDAQLDGVTLSYTVNGQARTVTTEPNSGGTYEILVPRTWTGGTITPSKDGITFAPAYKTYTNLQTSLTAEDYSLRLTFTSIAGYDGFVLEANKNSGVGGPTVNSTGQVIRLGDNLDRQYRSILSFDTSILPDDAIIQWATLKIRRQGNIVGTDPFTTGFGVLKADICEGKFGNLLELETADFNAGTTSSVPCLINAMNSNGFNTTPSNGWHSASLSSNGLGYIHLVPSVTQLRLYFDIPNNNNGITDYIDFDSGEAAAGLKPELVIAYRLP